MKVFTIVLLMLCSSLSYADYEVQQARFYIDEVHDVRSGTRSSEMVGVDVKALFELSGFIEIEEFDEETFSLKVTTIRNVVARFKFYGIFINLLSSGTAPSFLRIENLSGKPISTIFDHRFYGGNISLAAAFVLEVNPNLNSMWNSDGVRMAFNEMWINGPSVGADIRLGYMTIDFLLEQDGERTDIEVDMGIAETSKRRLSMEYDQIKDIILK